MSRNRSGWTAGADRIAARDWSGEVVQMPSGRLHAVSDPGLIVGRACVWPGDPARPARLALARRRRRGMAAVLDLPRTDPRPVLTAAGWTTRSASEANEDQKSGPQPGPCRAGPHRRAALLHHHDHGQGFASRPGP
jgi:hypothetical protein